MFHSNADLMHKHSEINVNYSLVNHRGGEHTHLPVLRPVYLSARRLAERSGHLLENVIG